MEKLKKKLETKKQEKKIRQSAHVKHSIRRQFALVFIVLMSATIFLCWLMNSVSLERFYLKNKQKALMTAYQKINTAVSKDELLSEDFLMNIRQVCDKDNISFIVLNPDGTSLAFTQSDPELMKKQLQDQYYNETQVQRGKYLVETEQYSIRCNEDWLTKEKYIEMWGILDDGYLFLIRSALESISISANIANTFLLYTGILTSVLSAVIIWIISRKITQPIYKLTGISAKMANLDFSEKYTGRDKNEFAALGEHINILSDTLESTISELKSANIELKKDIAKKEQLDEMRKDFLSNVSHELKTPIALIQGYAEGLKEGINDDEASRDFYCEVIMDEANKMNAMVKKLLDLNQLEFGQDVITMEHFDIVALIQNYLQSADILIKQHNAGIIFDEKEPVFVWADEFKIEEVFSNYFSNALNHLSENGTIAIRLLRYDDKVRVSVHNTGLPIPEDSIDHVWEKFYKVDKARTREYGGSGVGLSIVKAIMDSMNQNYGVENNEDGVTFWFDLDAK